MSDFVLTTILVGCVAIAAGATITYLLGGQARAAVRNGLAAGIGAVAAFAVLPILFISAGPVAWGLAFGAFALLAFTVIWTAMRRVGRK